VIRSSTLCEAFQDTVASKPAAIALRTFGGAVEITWRDYADRVRAIAAGLAELGVGPGDTVGLMLTNRPEFHLVDTAALHLGAAPFSIYNTSPPEAIAYLFANAGNKVVVCEQQFLPVLREALEGGAIKHIVCVDGAGEGVLSLAELESAPQAGFDYDAAWRAVRPEDLATIIYTSGTTGPPKGVEITHANIIANVSSVFDFIEPAPDERVVSYLPDAHAANRWFCHWTSLLVGTQITTLANPKEALATLTEVRPTLFVGVPQLWYKLKATIESTLAAERSPVKRTLGQWAVRTGCEVARRRTRGETVPAALALQHRLADRLVLSKVRAKLGLDAVRWAASGAAPIDPDALEFMLGLGILVCEAWGMSELTAAATVNRPDATRIGTVGTPLSGVEVRVAEDGELLVRGPNVMRGYRDDPARTAEVLDADGWLHTGDIGTVDQDGYVRIVDRKKEIMINSSGKNMSPSNIENVVKVACPLAGSVVAIGDRRPYVVALLTLDPDAAAAFAATHGLTDTSLAAVAGNSKLQKEIEAGIELANRKLSRVEQIKKFTVLPVEWTPGGEELTPTMKLRRKPIATRYATQIEDLYTG
jgi:long-chain acyl-CoA synthetase